MKELTGRRRILVVGCCGAGKSTFARDLGAATGLPVVHLDRLYWSAGWVPVDGDRFRRELEALLARPGWIIDGAYVMSLPRRLEAADAVVHLDLPRALCYARVAKRILRGYGRSRADLAEGCPEKLDREFLHWVWRWHRDQRPLLLRALEEAPPAVHVVTPRSRGEVADLLRYAGGRGADAGEGEPAI